MRLHEALELLAEGGEIRRADSEFSYGLGASFEGNIVIDKFKYEIFNPDHEKGIKFKVRIIDKKYCFYGEIFSADDVLALDWENMDGEL